MTSPLLLLLLSTKCWRYSCCCCYYDWRGRDNGGYNTTAHGASVEKGRDGNGTHRTTCSKTKHSTAARTIDSTTQYGTDGPEKRKKDIQRWFRRTMAQSRRRPRSAATLSDRACQSALKVGHWAGARGQTGSSGSRPGCAGGCDGLTGGGRTGRRWSVGWPLVYRVRAVQPKSRGKGEGSRQGGVDGPRKGQAASL